MQRIIFIFLVIVFSSSCGSDSVQVEEKSNLQVDTSLYEEQTHVVENKKVSKSLYNLFPFLTEDTITVTINKVILDSKELLGRDIPDSLFSYLDLNMDCSLDRPKAMFRVSVNDSVQMLAVKKSFECYAFQVHAYFINKKSFEVINESTMLSVEFGDAGEQLFADSKLILNAGQLVHWYVYGLNSFEEPGIDEAVEERNFYIQLKSFEKNRVIEEQSDSTLSFFIQYQLMY